MSETPVNRNHIANIGKELYVVVGCYKWILNLDISKVMLPLDSECRAAIYEEQSSLPQWDSHYFPFLSPLHSHYRHSSNLPGLETTFLTTDF